MEPRDHLLGNGLVVPPEVLNLHTSLVERVLKLLRLVILDPCFMRDPFVGESLVLGSKSRTLSMPPPSMILPFGACRVSLARGHPGALGAGVLRALLQVNLDD